MKRIDGEWVYSTLPPHLLISSTTLPPQLLNSSTPQLLTSEEEDALWPHIEEQVENAQVRQKAMLTGKYLIVRAGNKVSIGLGVLGVDGCTEIGNRGLCITSNSRWGKEGSSVFDMRVNVEQLTHRLADRLIEIKQPLPAVFGEEGTQVVLVILKER